MPSLATRRRLLGGGAALAVGGALDAFVLEPNWLDVTEHEVPVPGLPRGLSGFTIAQVTDAHLQRIGRVEDAISQALRVHDVQLLVLTGDIIDSTGGLDTLREFCSGVRRQGMAAMATLGNWEHWGEVPLPTLRKAYADTNVKLLVNEATVLPDGLQVFATDDSTGGSASLDGLRHPQGDARLLLTHSPELLDRAPTRDAGIALALAGHTHGGQLRLGASAVPFLPVGSGRFVSGWYDVAGCAAYVARGTGTSIVPARFTCRPELPIFRLRQG
jgi:predicted MPP superfamily phosphohydrolase